MDRERPVRVRRGIVWFGAPALMLLIKLGVDAKDPSIVAQVRSELYTLTARLLQTVVMPAIDLAWNLLQEPGNQIISRICILVDRRTMRTTTAASNKDRIPSPLLKAIAARINGYCRRSIVHQSHGAAQGLLEGAAEIALKIKGALVPRLNRSAAAAATIRTPPAFSTKSMEAIAVPAMLFPISAGQIATYWLARFQNAIAMKIANAVVSEAWTRRWEILNIIMLLGLSAVILKSLYLLGQGIRAASRWLKHVGTRVMRRIGSAIVLPIWRKRWLIMAILVMTGSAVLLKGFFDRSWEMGHAALVAKEELDSTYHRLQAGGSWRGSWVERTSRGESAMMDFEPAPK